VAYSLATSGCPLHCQFCQNWEISQIRPEDYEVSFTSPETIVNGAQAQHAPVIAFTYNEPTVFIEYLTDIARNARQEDLRSVLISCGFMNQAPLAEMCSVLDAIKIDLKGFSEDFYHRVCSADLRPVLRSIKQVSDSGKHLEIVNLMVPTLNDSDEMVHGLCDWVLGELGPDVPVHFTRFHPDYKLLNLAQTPVATLERARDFAMSKGMHYAYVGNVNDLERESTYCPTCKAMVIGRDWYELSVYRLDGNRCGQCDTVIPGVFDDVARGPGRWGAKRMPIRIKAASP
jgi:pyruvate formate lyase activating enzyme